MSRAICRLESHAFANIPHAIVAPHASARAARVRTRIVARARGPVLFVARARAPRARLVTPTFVRATFFRTFTIDRLFLPRDGDARTRDGDGDAIITRRSVVPAVLASYFPPRRGHLCHKAQVLRQARDDPSTTARALPPRRVPRRAPPPRTPSTSSPRSSSPRPPSST